LSVLLLLKGGIDAIRVAGGEEHVVGAPFDALTEMVVSKATEMTIESIPNSVVLAVFLISGGEWTFAAIVAIVLSCMSTAFTVTMLAYDMDTSAARRKATPTFYGYIADSTASRLWTFTLLLVYHGAHTIAKTFTVALLIVTNWVWLVGYIVADHCLFVLSKVVRADFFNWAPGSGLLMSLLSRFMIKVLGDFTGNVCASLGSLLRVSCTILHH